VARRAGAAASLVWRKFDTTQNNGIGAATELQRCAKASEACSCRSS
jgi:hypothetical protein